MARGERTKTGKQEIFQEICDQIGLPFVQSWKSTGSTITATGFEAVLCKTAERTGIPPAHLEEHEKLKWRLLHKSLDGMVLALEIINKPTVSYRMETFLFLALNAWELLLKARLVSTKQHIESIYNKDNPDRTITFQYALKAVFPQEKDPIRMNLLRIEVLRNHAVHLFIPFVPRNASLVFQAAILNYEAKAKEWFKRSLLERLPQGMMFLVADLAPDQPTMSSPIIQRGLHAESLEFIAEWQKAVQGDIENLKQIELSRYIIPINFNLAIVNNPNKADVIATFSSEVSGQAVGVKYQGPLDRYPLSYQELWNIVRGREPTIKPSEFNKLIKDLGIKEDERFSVYSFRTKRQEEEFKKGRIPRRSLTSIYNQKAAEEMIGEFQKRSLMDSSSKGKTRNL